MDNDARRFVEQFFSRKYDPDMLPLNVTLEETIDCARAYADEREAALRAENERLKPWKSRYGELLALLDQRDGPPVYSQVLQRAEQAEADRAALLTVAKVVQRLFHEAILYTDEVLATLATFPEKEERK